MRDFPTILVVDDEPRGVELLVRTLSEIGTVIGAESGEQAWELASRRRVDLIVADQRMPGMTGVDLLERVAQSDPYTGRILLTAYADQAATVYAINRGRVHAYLNKPCLPEQLLMTVKSVLERVRLARENDRLLVELYQRNEQLEAAMQELRSAQERVVHAERLSMIGQMMAMLVHDLRGPLSVIHSTGNEFATEAERLSVEEIRSLGEMIRSEGRRVDHMCRELLDISRQSAEALPLESTALDTVIEEALGSLAETAAHQGVRIESRLEAGVELLLDADALRRALLNLVHNALEAMAEGGGTVEVASAVEGEWALVRVEDSGPGIAPKIRERLFEPFVTEGKPGGSGLGLAVVKKVVDDHGGRIRVGKSARGGALFELSLPVRR